MTRQTRAVPPNEAPHPEAPDNRRLGARTFVGVSAAYGIERVEIRGRTVTTVAVTNGTIAHWFAPFVHAELPSELAKLRDADESQILDFASTYGSMGYLADTESVLKRLEQGKSIFVGDPLSWLRAHANGIHTCLAITDALRTPGGRRQIPALLKRVVGTAYATIDDIRTIPQPKDVSSVDAARIIRARIINDNVGRIYRYIHVDKGGDRSFYGYHAVIDVAYWHLANVIDGGIVKRCEADGCDGLFIQTDQRQRYCPKRWRQRESACAMRQRQREARR